VKKIPESRRKKHAYKRLWRRRRLITQRAALWVATHGLNAKPPTELHRKLQAARRQDETFFIAEFLPVVMGLLSPTPPGMTVRVLRRECCWCGWPATAKEVHCFRCEEQIDVLHV
jgi:hypothetical protein